MSEKQISSHSHKCASCGDDMRFNPEKCDLICPSCKCERAIKHNTNFTKHPYDKNANLTDKNDEWAKDNKIMKCPNCGASVLLAKYEVTATCPYCTTPLIANRGKTAVIKPDAVIPFKFGIEKAEKYFKEQINKKFFAPRKFKRMVKASEIYAYYFPSFAYDANCSSSYSGKLYRDYTKTDSEGKTMTERRYFTINGNKSTQHRNVQVEASTKLTQEELESVLPYNYSAIVEFQSEYIAGYSLECYSSSLKETHEISCDIIKSQIKEIILNGYNYDGVSYLNVDTNFSEEKYSYCILPIYRINFTYKKKSYSNVLNGQTGALGGKTPVSPWKVMLVVLIPLLLLALPIVLSLIVGK